MSNKSKVLMVFTSKKKSKWLKTKVKKLSSEFSEVIIINKGEKSDDFSDNNNLQIRKLEDFIADEITYQERKFQIDFVVNISKRLFRLDHFRKEFILDDVNTWWFLPNKIFSQIRNHDFIAVVSALNNLIEKFKPSLIIFDSQYEHSEILRKICGKKLLLFKTQNAFLKKFTKKISRFFINQVISSKRWINSLLEQNWSRTVVRKSEYKKSSKSIICYLSHAPYFRLGYTIEGKIEEHEIYQKNILLEIDKLGEFDHYSLEVLKDFNERKMFNKIHKIRSETKNIPLYYYHSFALANKTSKNRRITHRRLKKLFKNEQFKDVFSFEEISLLDAYSFQMFRIFKTEMSNACEKIVLFERAIQDFLPKNIILHNEHSAFGKSLIFAAKKLQIPTIAMQHGNIEFASPEYFISDKMICKNSKFVLNEYCDHLADLTLVHGEKIKDLLVKFGGYSKESVKVVGNPQWDIIQKTEHFDKAKFLKEIKFSEKIKTIAILSQALPVNEHRIYFNKKVTETLSETYPNLQIIWKPHPRENTSEIADLVNNQYNLSNAIITKNLSLFDILHACDVAITIHSTAGLEAMLFDKPVITFIPPGELENSLFENTGAVIKVETKKELASAINQTLFDEAVRKKLKTNRNKLINNLAKFDGNASKRSAKIVTQMIKEK